MSIHNFLLSAILSISFVASANASQYNSSYQELSNIFCKPIFNKISSTTKNLLVKNNFILPETESILMVKSRNKIYTIAIDLSSNIGDRGSVYLGQIIDTKEFVACKNYGFIIRSTDYSYKALDALGRLRAIVDKEKQSFIIQPLINGVTFSSNEFYDAMKHLNVHHKAKVALSFLEELKFCYERRVFQTDEGPHNIMYDLKDSSVKLIDFSGVKDPIMNFEINNLAISIVDQARIYEIFGVTINSVKNRLESYERAAPYGPFLESLIDCQWSITKGPNLLRKLTELKELFNLLPHRELEAKIKTLPNKEKIPGED